MFLNALSLALVAGLLAVVVGDDTCTKVVFYVDEGSDGFSGILDVGLDAQGDNTIPCSNLDFTTLSSSSLTGGTCVWTISTVVYENYVVVSTGSISASREAVTDTRSYCAPPWTATVTGPCSSTATDIAMTVNYNSATSTMPAITAPYSVFGGNEVNGWYYYHSCA